MENNQSALINKKNAVWIGIIGLALTFFLYQIIGSSLAFLIFGFDIINAPKINFKLFTIASHLLFILAPALYLLKFYFKDPNFILNFRRLQFIEILALTFGFGIVYFVSQFYAACQEQLLNYFANNNPFFKAIKDAIDAINRSLESSYVQLLKADSFFDYAITFFLIAFLPAIGEEILFRGFSQNCFSIRLKAFGSIFLTSILFSAFHFNLYGFIPLFLISVLLGYAFYYSKTIAASMYIHFLNNFLSLIAYYSLGAPDTLKDTAEFNFSWQANLFLLIFSLSLFVLYLRYLKEFYKRRTLNI